MTFKANDKVQIRNDEGQFSDDIIGTVIECASRSKTVVVIYNGREGVFHKTDLKKIKS